MDDNKESEQVETRFKREQKEEHQGECDWTAYAIDACMSIVDASMFWDSDMEDKNPPLKRARTMAGEALRRIYQRAEYLRRSTS